MRPTKLSSNVFHELPPVLAHYLEADRNLWLDGNPRRGRLSLLNRSGSFTELESQAVERRHLLSILGPERTRALLFRTGFEMGRRDAARHYKVFGENGRLALQAGLVFGQLQGKYIAETIKFEFNLNERTLYREMVLRSCAEAIVHRMTLNDPGECVCANTAGYVSGHVSEILGRRILTMETECVAHGAEACRFISRLDHEFGEEVDWMRQAMTMQSVDEELSRRDQLVASAQKAARRAQASLGGMSRRARSGEFSLENIVAESDKMKHALSRARQFTDSDAAVLLSGEAGSGKGIFARAIHSAGPRKDKAFVEVDTEDIPADRLAQELFGYTASGVPGALQEYTGALARANGGTLYLGEIGSLPLDLQGRLAKALQSGLIRPVGAQEDLAVDVRLVAGTRGDLQNMLDEGKLRDDLFYTLSISRIDIPPLRERPEDILRLADEFLRESKLRHERPKVSMSGEFLHYLSDCAWPGNVSQLRQVIETAVIMTQEGELSPADLPEEVLASPWTRKPKALTAEVIKATLSRTNNNRSQAAELLGVGRTTLWRSMKRLGIQ